MSATTHAAKVLIIDDSRLCRAMVRKAICGNGMASVEATDGFDGFAQLGKHQFDAIILDNEMPKMGGLAFLKALRSDARWADLPVLMLTTTVSKSLILEASKYGLSGYLLKARLSMPDLVTRINSATAKPAASQSKPKPKSVAELNVPNLVSRETTLNAVTHWPDIRTLPGVVSRIVTIAESPKQDISEIAAVVRQDPILSMRIIHRATSVDGVKASITSIDDAVRIVGVEEIRDLASSMQVFTTFATDKPDGIDLLRCWEHALTVASIMSRLVPRTDNIPQGLPYMIGLCHDLGEILLRQRFPTEFAAAEDFARQAEVPTADLFHHVFGLTYSEMMEALFDRLKLPPMLAAPIKEYHFSNPGDESLSTLAHALSIANSLAHSMLCATSSRCLIAPISAIGCRTSLIPTIPVNLPEICSESIMSICLLANVGLETESAFIKPLLPRVEINVCYVRCHGFASLDPIESALRTLCKIELHDRMPQAEELSRFQGIVIASRGSMPIRSQAIPTQPQIGKRIPALLLTGDPVDQAEASPTGVEMIQYPVLMSRIAQFISALPK